MDKDQLRNDMNNQIILYSAKYNTSTSMTCYFKTSSARYSVEDPTTIKGRTFAMSSEVHVQQ